MDTTGVKTTMAGAFATSPVMVKSGKEALIKFAFDDTALGIPSYLDSPAQDWGLNVNFDQLDITPIGAGGAKLKINNGRTITGSVKKLVRADDRSMFEVINTYAVIEYDSDGAGASAPARVTAQPNKQIGLKLIIDSRTYYEGQAVLTSVAQASGGATGSQTFDINFEFIGDLTLKVVGA